MLEKKRKTYDAEFKRRTVALADSSDKTDRAIEKELGVYQGSIRHWREELTTKASAAFPGKGNIGQLEEHNRLLERELQRVTMERDILKKAVAIFSLPSRTGTHS